MTPTMNMDTTSVAGPNGHSLGADLKLDGRRDAPRGVAAAYTELLTPAPFNLTTFPNEEGYDELVAEHLCMSLPWRAEAGCALTITSALHGLVRDDPGIRQEFLTLTRGRS